MARIPKRNAEIAALGVRVVTAWANYPTLDMDWITQADAVTLTTNYYNIILQTSQTEGSERIKVQTMRELDEEINSSLYFIKQLIGAEYGRDALYAQYVNFGIRKESGGYVIPRERDSRIQSLRLMVSSLTTAPFSGNAYGLAYWQDILTRYIAAKEDLEAESMKLTGDVTDKSKLRNDVQRLLRSLKYLVMAFFPDTHDRVLRDFGYLDEYV
jgi:hypothetical protein